MVTGGELYFVLLLDSKLMKMLSRILALCALLLVAMSFCSCGSATVSSPGNPGGILGGTSTLKLKNKLYTDVMVRLGGPETREIIVPGRSTETLQLKSGVYRYIAGAKDFRPIERYKALEPNRTHTVYF